MKLPVRPFRSDRSCLLLITVAWLLICCPGLGGRDFWDPDEPRVALVTGNILRTGSWSVPRLQDRPYLEKPPLYYWIAAAASVTVGRVDEVTARLPANAAALLTAMLVFRLGRGLYGRRAGALAGLVFLTTFDVFLESRWARPDMLLALLLTSAVLCLREALPDEERGGALSGGWLVGFYVSVGLAVLTKGPPGLLPIAAALVWLLATRRAGLLKRSGIIWGAPLMALPAALWIAAWSASEGRPYPLVQVIERFGDRVVHGIHHAHPWTHLAETLPLALLPWVILLPAAILDHLPRRETVGDERLIFIGCFALSYLALFTLSAEKRGVYLLPILPFQALLVGRLWDSTLLDWDPHPAGRPVRFGLLTGALLSLAGAAYYLPKISTRDPELLLPAAALAVTVVLAAGLPALMQRRFGPGAAVSCFATGLTGCYLILGLVVLPSLDRHKSARPFATLVAEAAGTDPLGIYPDPHPGLSWYAGRSFESLPDASRLEAFLRSGPRTFCVIEDEAWAQIESGLVGQASVIARGRIGHRSLVLVQGGAGSRVTTDAAAEQG